MTSRYMAIPDGVTLYRVLDTETNTLWGPERPNGSYSPWTTKRKASRLARALNRIDRGRP
jgi:hypothetical protein